MFDKFPKIKYNFPNMSDVEMQDIFRRVKFTESTENDPGNFETYIVDDGDKPENVAKKVYGNEKYWWVVLLSNGIIDIESEWHKSSTEMNFLLLGYLDGYSYFVMESLDTQPKDIMVKRDIAGTGGIDIDNFGIVDKYDKVMHRIDVKQIGGSIDVDDEFQIYRNIGISGDESKYTLISGFGDTGCYYQSYGDTACSVFEGPDANAAPLCATAGATFAKVYRKEKIKDAVKEFTYQSDVINPHSRFLEGVGISGDFFSFQNLCGMTGTILYQYITDSISSNVGVTTLEYNLIKENEKKRTIRLISPSLLSQINTEFTSLLSGNIPRGTTKIIE